MKVTVILIVLGAFETVPKGPEKRLRELEIKGRIKTIQTTGLLNQLEHSGESWKPEEFCCHSDFCGKSPVCAVVKNLQVVN